jgi:hypothetical protein
MACTADLGFLRRVGDRPIDLEGTDASLASPRLLASCSDCLSSIALGWAGRFRNGLAFYIGAAGAWWRRRSRRKLESGRDAWAVRRAVESELRRTCRRMRVRLSTCCPRAGRVRPELRFPWISSSSTCLLLRDNGALPILFNLQARE